MNSSEQIEALLLERVDCECPDYGEAGAKPHRDGCNATLIYGLLETFRAGVGNQIAKAERERDAWKQLAQDYRSQHDADDRIGDCGCDLCDRCQDPTTGQNGTQAPAV